MKVCIAKYLYELFMVLVFTAATAFRQIKVVHFNAGWNEANNVEWFSKISDADIDNISIDDAAVQKKYAIAIVPTIVIFDDGEEVKRYQADLSFKMAATREEVQEYIDELIMSKF